MRVLLAAGLLAFAAPALADEKIDRLAPAEGRNLQFDALQWFDDPTLPKGAKVSPIAGDPSKPGVFMVYVKLPPDYAIPAHTHPYAEVITVLKGSVGNGHGETFDRAKGEMLTAGSSFVLPAGHAHYLWNDEEVVALLVAAGPWDIAYVDPRDDPRNQKK